jgi:transposase
MQANAAGIADGSVIVLYIDECHLIWQDACGYVWGPRNQRIELPIANQRERQSYYGAIDAMTGNLIVIPCDGADGRWTMIFVEFLRQQFEGKRLIICWDGASYHRSEEMQEYLEGVNMGKSRDEWTITCVQFAAYAPEQNPIENVWLQAKDFLRKNWHQCTLFQHVTSLFEQALNTISFNFDRLRMYTQDLQLI